MRRSLRKFLPAICLLAVLAGLAAGWFSPERQAARYVKAHQAELQEAMDRATTEQNLRQTVQQVMHLIHQTVASRA